MQDNKTGENKPYEDWFANKYKELNNAYNRIGKRGGEVIAISGKLKQMNEDEGMLRDAFEGGASYILETFFTEEKIQYFATMLSFGRAYLPELFEKKSKTNGKPQPEPHPKPEPEIKNWRYICRNCGWNIPAFESHPKIQEVYCGTCKKWRKFDKIIEA